MTSQMSGRPYGFRISAAMAGSLMTLITLRVSWQRLATTTSSEVAKGFGQVDDQKAAGFQVSTACQAAGVSTSGYNSWTPPSWVDVSSSVPVGVLVPAHRREPGVTP